MAAIKRYIKSLHDAGLMSAYGHASCAMTKYHAHVRVGCTKLLRSSAHPERDLLIYWLRMHRVQNPLVMSHDILSTWIRSPPHREAPNQAAPNGVDRLRPVASRVPRSAPHLALTLAWTRPPGCC